MNKETEERIKADAEAYATLQWGDMAKFHPNDIQHVKWDNSLDDYIAGATAEHDRAQPLIDMLMNIRAFIAGATAGAMHPFTSLITLDKEIEAVLEQWRGKEVKDE